MLYPTPVNAALIARRRALCYDELREVEKWTDTLPEL